MNRMNATFAFLFRLYLNHPHSFYDEYHDVNASFLHQCMVLKRHKQKEVAVIYVRQSERYAYFLLDVDDLLYSPYPQPYVIVVVRILHSLCDIDRGHVNELSIVIFPGIEPIALSNA